VSPRDTKVVFGGDLWLELARKRPRLVTWGRDGPNTAFVSPFGKRETAQPAIGIVLGVIENKNFLGTKLGFPDGCGKNGLGQFVEERRDVSVVNVLFDERFLTQGRHTVGQLILECGDFHLEEYSDRYLVAPLERL